MVGRPSDSYVEKAPAENYGATTSQPIDNWTLLEGLSVDFYRNGKYIRRGRVDAVTNDGGILWLAQEGIHSRQLVEKLPGTELRIFPAYRLY